MKSAETAEENAEKAVLVADAELKGAKAKFNALNNDAAVTVNSNGTVALGETDLVILKDGKLVLASAAITEAKYPGLTALLNASKAKEAADVALTNAEKAVDSAQALVDRLDLSEAETAALKAIATSLKLTAGTLPTSAQIDTKTAQLAALQKTAFTAAGIIDTESADDASDAKAAYDDAVSEYEDALAKYIDDALSGAELISAYAELKVGELDDATAIVSNSSAIEAAYKAQQSKLGTAVAAEKDVNDFAVLVEEFNDATDAAGANPLLDKLKAAESAISNEGKTGIQDKITALDSAIKALAVAQADANTLKSLNDAITAAEKAFIDNDMLVPVTLSGTELASASSDIYLAGSDDSLIVNFGLLGSDALYIGTGYTFNSGTLADGKASVLEAFFLQEGNDAKVVLETKAYSSAEAGVPEITITLTGVNIADLVLKDGVIMLA